MDRRNFFITTAAAAAASTTVFGSPNDTIRVATIGLRGRGKDHIKEITGQPNVELVALSPKRHFPAEWGCRRPHWCAHDRYS